MLLALFLLATGGTAQAVTPSPKPSPPVTVTAVASAYSLASSDAAQRTDFSALLATVARSSGAFRYTVVAGEYAFPVVGLPLAGTAQAGANTALYGPVPVAYVQDVPNARWAFSAGKMPTLLGQESMFTFENANIQRGLAWNAEPVVSRGVRVAFTQGKLDIQLGDNDGYYSGRLGTLEGAVAWSPSASSSFAFALIIPPSGSPGNPTATIANKREYNLMLTQAAGKWTFSPYLLLIDSPASLHAGFAAGETAMAAVLLADYAADGHFSVGMRYEDLRNWSSAGDTSANADLIGFGPGSSATSMTITPQYRFGTLEVRAEFSKVSPSGTSIAAEQRFGLEAILQP